MSESPSAPVPMESEASPQKGDATFDIREIACLSASVAEEKKLLRKIDRWILPLMALTYMLQFMDKVTLSYGSIMGLITDTHLVGSEYSWAASIFYFGYFFWTYPTSYLVVRFPLGPYLAVTVGAWGTVLMCHAACTGFAGLMVARFFLGVTEAAATPGFALVVGMFYTRDEQPLRQNAWATGNAVANIIGGLIAYAVGTIQSPTIARWRVLFILLGGVTVVWAVVLFIFLPASPAKARFLTVHERELALHRTLANKTGTMDESTYKKGQVLEALMDPQAWLMCGYMLCISIPTGALTSFTSIIISSFGFSLLDTFLLQMPPGVFQLITLAYTGIYSRIFPNSRGFLMLQMIIISLVGILLIYCLPTSNKVGRLIGIYLGAAFSSNLPLVLSLISANVAGFTKKATVSAMLFIAYSVGNIIGPQFFLTREAPHYETGYRAVIASVSFAATFVILLIVYYFFENRRRDRVNGSLETLDESTELAEEFSNLTDKQLKGFRYVL